MSITFNETAAHRTPEQGQYIEKHFSTKKGQSCEILSYISCDFLSVSSIAHCDFGEFSVFVKNNSCESKGDSDSRVDIDLSEKYFL